ncbi:MAG: hypothetical protein LC437_09840 [Thiohalomonas sp.]|nr:hypothetical protein [Thiohalomonas sp.]
MFRCSDKTGIGVHVRRNTHRVQVSRSCLLLRLLDELKKQKHIRHYQKKYQFFQALFHNLQQELADNLDELLDRIKGLLENRYRASSAIEGFNSVLRPYLYVRKGVNQNFLELFKAWYNLKTRRKGRYKGTSAHECISGQKVDDWVSSKQSRALKKLPLNTVFQNLNILRLRCA